LAQLIKASDIKVITKDGECKLSINIELNINLNSVGSLANQQEAVVTQKETDKASTIWEIPDFETIPKINFGKKA